MLIDFFYPALGQTAGSVKGIPDAARSSGRRGQTNSELAANESEGAYKTDDFYYLSRAHGAGEGQKSTTTSLTAPSLPSGRGDGG
jgi:hypothetical protein